MLARARALIDVFFFIFAGLASIWLVFLIFDDIGRGFWAWGVFFLLFWAALAYLVLPRLHRLFTAIYVPDYFIGRSRTTEGLLGDPVNLAFNGTEEDIHKMMQAAGWKLADPINLKTSLGIVWSTVTRKSYDNAPVSTLKLFDTPQHFAYQQEVDGNPSKRHHIRFWRCPDDWPLPGGSKHVQWMAAATFDRAVGLSLFTLQVTHKIGSDIDTERDHVVNTLKQVDPDLQVSVLEDFSTAYHSVNGGGDAVETDGDLPIVTLTDVPEALPEPVFDKAQLPVATDDPTSSRNELARIPKPFGVYSALFLIGIQLVISALRVIDLLRNQDSLLLVVEDIIQDALSPAEMQELWKSGVDSSDILMVAIFGVAAIAVLRTILAWLMWQGYNGGRTLLMFLEGTTVIMNFLEWSRVNGAVPFGTAFLLIAIAIMLLLILSSPTMTDFTKATKTWRRHKRAAKRAKG